MKLNLQENTEPHKIKWHGWLLLVGLICGTIYIVRQQHPEYFESNSKEWDSELVKRNEGAVFGFQVVAVEEHLEEARVGFDETLGAAHHVAVNHL